MLSTSNTLRVVASRLVLGFLCGAGLFLITVLTLGTFFSIGVGCLFFGGLAAVAGANGSLTVFTAIAIMVPFFMYDWGNAGYTAILTVIASEVASFIFDRMFGKQTWLST